MFSKTKFLLLLCAFMLLCSNSNALTDYLQKSDDYEGEYTSTHDDITTVGVQEKEPTLEQAEEIRKENLDQLVEPKLEPEPDLDLSKPEDQVLLEKIQNGNAL